MTTQEVKKIPLADLLGSIGYFPEHSQKNGNEFWYKSPLRKEKTPSFKITIDKNTWYDFGASAGGSVIDFVMAYNHCDVSNAFQKIRDQKIISVAPKLKNVPTLNKGADVELRAVKDLNNPALISFLQDRGINIEIAKQYVSEVYYRRSEKNYFTVGMKNDSDGFEVRTKFFKGCILSKDLTSITGGFETVSVFEGFIDFLSLLTIKNTTALKSDVIILNSTSQMKKAIDLITSYYKKIFAFVDNDDAGQLAFEKLNEIENIEVKDMRYLYPTVNDLNDELLRLKLHNQ